MTATATAAAVAWLLAVATTLGFMGAPRGVHELQITIGDVTVRALCTDGPRDALLLHDAGSTSDSWRPVLERLDEHVGACAYDRRGSGMSVPPPSERGWYEFLDELRHVHRALGFDRDYLLVGHGLGGLYARMYVIDRPRELGALLLVDPSHEDMPDRFAGRYARTRAAGVDRTAQRPEFGWHSEGIAGRSVAAPAHTSGPRDGPDRRPAIRGRGVGSLEFIAEASRQLHAEILQGAAVPRRIPADRSGHDVPRDQPQLVVDEILRLRGFLER